MTKNIVACRAHPALGFLPVSSDLQAMFFSVLNRIMCYNFVVSPVTCDHDKTMIAVIMFSLLHIDAGLVHLLTGRVVLPAP